MGTDSKRKRRHVAILLVVGPFFRYFESTAGAFDNFAVSMKYHLDIKITYYFFVVVVRNREYLDRIIRTKKNIEHPL